MLKPMSIYQAIEVMKILRPHIETMNAASSAIDMVRRLMLAFKVENTEENVGRIVALTHGKAYEEISDKYRADPRAEIVFADLVFALQANPIPDLIDAAYLLGLSDKPWSLKDAS